MKAFYALLFSTAIVSCTPSHAQTVACADTKAVQRMLKDKQGEDPDTLLNTGDNTVIIYKNQETKTWTMFLMRMDGVSCFLAEGEGFETIDLEIDLGEPL